MGEGHLVIYFTHTMDTIYTHTALNFTHPCMATIYTLILHTPCMDAMHTALETTDLLIACNACVHVTLERVPVVLFDTSYDMTIRIYIACYYTSLTTVSLYHMSHA